MELNLARPGEHRAEVNLSEGETVRTTHIVSWRVAAPWVVSPKMLVMNPGVDRATIIVQANPKDTFRIDGIDAGETGLTVSDSKPLPAGGVALTLHRGGEWSGHGRIRIRTDRPSSAPVDVPVMILP